MNQRYDAYGNVIPIFAHKLIHRGASPSLVTVSDSISSMSRTLLAPSIAAQNRGVSGAFGSAVARVTISSLVNFARSLQARYGIVHGPKRSGDARQPRDLTGIRAALGFEPRAQLLPALREYMDWAKQHAGVIALSSSWPVFDS